MKFPKKLSKERLSLLSENDRLLYENEHKYDDMPKSVLDEMFDSASIDLNETNLSEFQSQNYSEILSEELDNIYEEIFSDVMSYDEFYELKKELINIENYNVNYTKYTILEAEGLDSGAWVRGMKLGWLGTLLAAGLTGIAGLLATGFSRIQQTMALNKLKRYMNRVVEIIDSGFFKKRGWLTFLMPRRMSEVRGERNIISFKTIQEFSDREMLTSVMSAAHKLGYFATGDMMNISNAEQPQEGSGLDMFRQNVISKLNIVNR